MSRGSVLANAGGVPVEQSSCPARFTIDHLPGHLSWEVYRVGSTGSRPAQDTLDGVLSPDWEPPREMFQEWLQEAAGDMLRCLDDCSSPNWRLRLKKRQPEGWMVKMFPCLPIGSPCLHHWRTTWVMHAWECPGLGQITSLIKLITPHQTSEA